MHIVRFLISLNSGFKTQFADGFTYPNDSVAVSKFMAPGYLNLALGTDYIKDAMFLVLTLLWPLEKGERIKYLDGCSKNIDVDLQKTKIKLIY